ncbi:MAG: hypothetical protein EKK55_06935 [Rhodocyclaceae bacterium]|nr:MAG: hypothetical protein EKK55_06935 [Rhodocyclaceae bacterium]
MRRPPRLTRREQRLAAIPETERIEADLGGARVPVPFVASWSSELPNFTVHADPVVGGRRSLFRGGGRRGEGRPVFGKMDPGRQRLCVVRGLCQVCAGVIEGPAWLAMLLERATFQGRSLPVVREPAACTRCMAQALALCPGLRRSRPLIIP